MIGREDKWTWVWLSSLRTSEMLRIGYFGVVFVPIYSYGVISVRELDIGLSPELPSALFWLFLGSILLSAAHFLNDVFCPYLIKEYGSLDSYRGSLSSLVRDASVILGALKSHESKKLTEDLSEKFKGLSESEKEIVADCVAEINKDSLEMKYDWNGKLSEYEEKWKACNTSMQSLRVGITVCYAVSALILLAMMARQFLVVLCAAF
jgi:hypothetical protein